VRCGDATSNRAAPFPFPFPTLGSGAPLNLDTLKSQIHSQIADVSSRLDQRTRQLNNV